MTDEQTPRSGSRWEPAPDDETVARPATPPEPPVVTHAGAPAPASPATPRTWGQRVRSNGGLVGGALALVLFSGLGGVAIGHATAGPDRFGLVGERAPGGGFPAPGAGQLPPPRHGDDGDGLGTPPGSDDDGGGAGESGSTL